MGNAPAVQSGQQVNSGCATCPLQAEKPCDVDELEVKVEYVSRPEGGKEEGEEVVKTLKTNVVKRKGIVRLAPARGQRVGKTIRPYPNLSYKVNDLLSKYDFVIEALADYHGPKSAKRSKETKAKIEAKAKFVGLKCDRHEHGVLRMKQLSGSDAVDIVSMHVDTAKNEIPVKEFYATSYPLLDTPTDVQGSEVKLGKTGASGALFIFEFIKSIFNSMTPKEIEVVAQACGVRAKADAKAKNTDLRGLVRIFRKDVWTLGLKTPDLGKFEQESAGKTQLLTGQKEGTFSQEGSFANRSSKIESKTTTKSNGVVTTETETERWRGESGSSFKQTSTDYGGAIRKVGSESKYSDRDGSEVHGYVKEGRVLGKPIREQVEERLHESSGFDFVVARNGVEVPLGETYRKIKEGIEMFAKVLADVQSAFKKAPQVGWKFTFEISAFSGTIVLEIGPKPAAAIADGRYLPINYGCEGKIEIEIFKLKVTLSFGIEAMVLDSGLVLKVQGSIGIEVKCSVDLKLDLLTNPKKEIGIEGKYTGEIKVVGYVSLVGKTVAGAELSISAGFEFKDGKLIVDVTAPSFDLQGKLRTKPVTVKGYITVPWWWDKKIDPPIELLPGQDLYTFK